MSLTTTGGALVPRDMREAMDLARMMATTGFLAKDLQNNGAAMFVIEQAGRWNMSPYSVAMEVSFIQGKPMFSGKVVAAAIQASGILRGRLSYDFTGTGDDRTVTVSGLMVGEDKPRTISVRLRDAKTGNKVWVTQPDQQLCYHGARVWARRHAPEVMLGVYSEEEMPEPQRDPIPPARGETITSTAEPARAPAAAPSYSGPPLVVVAPDGSTRTAATPAQWQKWAIAAASRINDPEELRGWARDMEAHFADLSADLVAPVRAALTAQIDALDDAERGEAPDDDA